MKMGERKREREYGSKERPIRKERKKLMITFFDGYKLHSNLEYANNGDEHCYRCQHSMG